MTSLILILLYALGVTVYFRFFSNTDMPFEMMLVAWTGSAIAFLLVELAGFVMKWISYFCWKREHQEEAQL